VNAPDQLPTAIVADARPGPWGRAARFVVWVVIALPALYQIALLAEAIAGRVAYPYDLEWMEGGMLHHALRIRLGQGIYVPPSADFIPYLYTPLYPTLLALFGGPTGPSYLLGRAVSIAGLVGIAGTALASLLAPPGRPLGAALAGAALALGLFAACYPFVEGWYDLVRADTLFLFMVTAGIAGLPHWARDDDGIVGHGKIAAGAALLALAFFCKQTGIFYVAFGGLIVVAVNWRRAPTYVAMAGLLGTSTGICTSAFYIQKVETAKQVEILALGVQESLHDTILALIFVIIASLIASAGVLRDARVKAA